jgi:hypothetical protein
MSVRAAGGVRTKADLVRLLDASGIPFETIESGRCWMIVSPTLAARIMGAGIGEENAFWVPPALSEKGWNEGGNAGGQRTWIAPEGGPSGFFFSADGARWDVHPDLDPGRYRASPAPAGWTCYRTALVARSADGSGREITIARSMSLGEERVPAGEVLNIRFRHGLGNAGLAALERRIGLWSIIQLPCEEHGVVFLAGSPALRPYFGTLPPVARGDEGRGAWFPVKGGSRFKAGVSPSEFTGTLGFVRRSRVAEPGRRHFIFTTMSWDADRAGTYVDRPPSPGVPAPVNGDTAQVYCDQGTGDFAFCEIESHAPAPFLPPGRSEPQDIRISIARVDERDFEAYMTDRLGIEPVPRSALPA